MPAKTKIKILVIALCMTAAPFCVSAITTQELQQQIAEKNKQVDELQQQIAVYQENIRAKQKEALSLKNETAILNNKIAQTQLQITSTETQIKATELDIRDKQMKLADKEARIRATKENLAETLRQIHETGRESLLRIFLLNKSISAFFTAAEYAKNLQDNLQNVLSRLKTEREDIAGQKQALELRQKQLLGLKNNLALQKQELQGQVTYKKNLLAKTQQSEQKFNQLYTQALKEQEAISAQITALEKQKRQAGESRSLTDAVLQWPVPQNTITTYFHDPDYPFRYVYEHPAIDIRAKQGTAIHAATEGYVLTAKNAGMGYSYIAIIHANGLSTVYGHVSKIYVAQDQYVAKGAIIGLSGGMPGTPGAGPLTTGPHLHFEVRLNGIPVNALNYLP